MLYLSLLAVVIDVVTELAREDVLSELLYADGLVLVSEAVIGWKKRLKNGRSLLRESFGNLTLEETKVLVSGGITLDGLSMSKVDPRGVCSLRARITQICVYNVVSGSTVDVVDVLLCGGWPRRLSRNFACWECDGNIGEAVEQEEKLCDEVEAVREFTHLGDRVSVGGGC